MTTIFVSNPDALARAMNYASGILTVDGVLTGWPDGAAWPTQSEIDDLIAQGVSEIAADVSVTPRQARLVLLQAGYLDAAEAMLALPENKAAQITWEYALEIKRSDPLIAAIGGALGLTEAQIDAMFEAAKQL